MKTTWKDLPVEIQEKMLDNQVAQRNKRDPKVFIDCINSGFKWCASDEYKKDTDFWNKIILQNKINHFYTLYPKNSTEQYQIY